MTRDRYVPAGFLVARRRPAPQAPPAGTAAPSSLPAAATTPAAESIPPAASAAAPAGPNDSSPEPRKPHSDTDTTTQQEQQPLKAAGVEDSSGAALLPPRRRSPPAAVRAVGLLATFAVSGLMHEALLIICTGSWEQLGRQTVFFGLQVCAVQHAGTPGVVNPCIWEGGRDRVSYTSVSKPFASSCRSR